MNSYPPLPVFRKAIDVENTTEYGSTETLKQNYPNPFSDYTTISFSSDGGVVSIEIYDAEGRRVRTVTNRQYDRGQHEITIERGSMAPGIYFCKLVNGRNKSSRQMSVVN